MEVLVSKVEEYVAFLDRNNLVSVAVHVSHYQEYYKFINENDWNSDMFNEDKERAIETEKYLEARNTPVVSEGALDYLHIEFSPTGKTCCLVVQKVNGEYTKQVYDSAYECRCAVTELIEEHSK